ncbi:MAG: glycerol-3-phosphate 1-O-acyltransferase PlsB [Oceanococcus sp.]
MLGKIIWFLTWWLRKPLLKAIRAQVSPTQLHETLNLDPNVPVCYVLPWRSYVDRWVLEYVVAQHGLVPLRKSRNTLPEVGKAVCLYLPAVLDSKGGLRELHQQALDQAGFDLQLVPVSMFWGRDPGKETSLFRILFSDSENPGYLRKFLIILANGRNIVLNIGQPVLYREFVGEAQNYERITQKLVRVFRFHFRRQRNATLGPQLYTRNQVTQAVLANPGVRSVIADEAAASGTSITDQREKVRGYVDEIAAVYSTTTLRVLYMLLTWVWNRVYNGVEIHRIERAREAAAKGGVIYMPSHRSHMDYLLLSYVLFTEGLVPPHIAAGINLNFWPVGAILRRGGAFFLRRSFGGKKLYTAVFRAYLDYLVSRAFPMSFYPEGGRSRTGRLLKPKTGMMAMVTASYLRGTDKPVTIIPVYIGYDKVAEVSSYFKELRGSKVKKESIWEFLKVRKVLSRNYGKAYLSFGEPIELGDYLREQQPDWIKKIPYKAGQQPEDMPAFVEKLSLRVMTQINAAVVLSSSGLASMTLLATPQKAIAADELQEQIGSWVALQKAAPYGPNIILPKASAEELVAEAEPVLPLKRVSHPWGDLLLAEGRDGVLMTYTRNSVQHAFALPSLLASFFRFQPGIARADLVAAAHDLYPFLRTELHMRWPSDEVDEQIDIQIDAMLKLGLLQNDTQRGLVAPPVTTREFATLTRLGNVLRETLERYALNALLLQGRYGVGYIDRLEFEQESRLMAERLAIISGRDAPEFFDKALFRGFVDTLKEKGWVVPVPGVELEDGDERLSIDASVGPLVDRALGMLGTDIGQAILQLVHRPRGE